MSRNARTLSLLSVVMLVGSLVILVAQAPLAHANTTNRTYLVDTTSDADLASNVDACQDDSENDDCSFRQAIERSNSDGGNSTINFDLLDETDTGYSAANGGRWTIQPTSQLPELLEGGTVVLGRNDNPTFTPRVVLDGSLLSGSGVGLRIRSAGNVISRLVIVNFDGNTATTGYGVRISTASSTDNQIVGSYIGVLPQSSTPAPNERGGISIDGGASFNRVGGSGTNRNIISGNGTGTSQGDGIVIAGTTTAENVVENNYIGVGLDAGFNVVSVPNTGFGIQIADSLNNSIGGTTTTVRNVISSNGQDGIVLTGSQATGNTIGSNLVGVGADGATDLGNVRHGIQLLDGANNNTISGAVGSPLVISGNGGYGILISGTGTSSNTVTTAYIGVTSGGTSAVTNGQGGVRIQDNASSNNIGTAGAGNVISGNTGYGISIGRQNVGANNTNGNTLRNNIIGLNFSSLSTVPNTVGGILVDSSAVNTVIGGTSAGEGNIISGNGTIGASTPTGIVINATAVLSTTVGANTIGARRGISGGPFNTAAGNQGGGISVAAGAQQIQIGGTLSQANTIAFNAGNGLVVGSAATNVQINANSVVTNTLGGIIVTSVTSPTLLVNTVNGNQGGPGIQLTSTPGATLIENTVTGNSQAGMTISSSNRIIVNANIVTNNGQSGIAISGGDIPSVIANTATGNSQNGIAVSGGATRGTISSNTALQNTQSGVSVTASSPMTITLNTLQRNSGGAGLILTGPANTVRMSNNLVTLNGANGISLVGVSATTNLTMTTNTIRDNTGSGVLLTGDMTNVRIESNQVISNTVSGIQLGNGATPAPQRVRMVSNTMSRNGISPTANSPVGLALQALGIVFNPETSGTPGASANPNHDIDPPIASSLVVSQGSGGILTGRVLADGTAAACTTNPVTNCTLQLFNTDSTILDGQGADVLGAPVTLTTNGFFTSTLGFVPAQLALTATDLNGNTSEFAVFNATPAVSISPAQAISARPGDVITVTHRITNTGNIAFTKLSIGAETLPTLSRWTLTPTPATQFALAPNESRLISVTLRLPTGSDSQVRVGTTGPISVTLSSNSFGPDALTMPPVVDTVTILPSVVLNVSAGLNGSGPPNSVLAYPHTITNNGNVTTTVTLSAATTVGGLPAPTWTTTFTPTVLTLGPGQSGGTTVRVTVSSGASAGPPPTVAQTTLTATPSVSGVPDLTQVKIVTDTTTTTLQQIATMVPDREGDAGATETISFRHVVTNNSNGTATFRLSAVSSQGSVVTFTSLTTGVPLTNGTTFTIPNTPGLNQFEFLVNVLVERRLLPGQTDLVTVVLNDANGGIIGGASVQDTINVTQGVIVPRLWLPFVAKP
jgi:parallel beta-helix repeat protein